MAQGKGHRGSEKKPKKRKAIKWDAPDIREGPSSKGGGTFRASRGVSGGLAPYKIMPVKRHGSFPQKWKYVAGPNRVMASNLKKDPLGQKG